MESKVRWPESMPEYLDFGTGSKNINKSHDEGPLKSLN